MATLNDIKLLNNPHVFPTVDGELRLEDGIRCKYSTPLARAKLCEIALRLEPLVKDLNFLDIANVLQEENNKNIQVQCIKAIRNSLDLISFQRDANGDLVSNPKGRERDINRYCGDDAARFAINGQGHCHTLTSIMTAFLLPFSSILGIDLKYRGGCSLVKVCSLETVIYIVANGNLTHFNSTTANFE